MSDKDMTGDDMHVFKSGAKRSELKPRYDLIPPDALRRLAQRYTLGAEKYGEFNWQKGMPLGDTLNHIIDHLLVYAERVRAIQAQHPDDWQLQVRRCAGIPDDDLAGAMWGCAALMWLESNGALL